jgi:hypothetical protein
MVAQELSKISGILEQKGVAYAGVFGSFARGEEKPGSDIDILVRFNKPIGLFDFIGLEQELSGNLKRKVDLVTEDALSPYIKDSVMRDLQVFYGTR